MLRRSAAVTLRVLLFSVLASLAGAGSAQAHRLNVEYKVLPGQKVQVEGWFSKSDVPRGAKVQVFRSNGQLLTEGKLDDQGIFVFSFNEVEEFKVVVNAGAGHREEMQISAASLTKVTGPKEKKPAPSDETGEDPSSRTPRADRSSPISIKDVLLGIGLLLALAAFVLSLRNAQKLRELKKVSEEALRQRPVERRD